jgi:hypothetical protein
MNTTFALSKGIRQVKISMPSIWITRKSVISEKPDQFDYREQAIIPVHDIRETGRVQTDQNWVTHQIRSPTRKGQKTIVDIAGP